MSFQVAKMQTKSTPRVSFTKILLATLFLVIIFTIIRRIFLFHSFKCFHIDNSNIDECYFGGNVKEPGSIASPADLINGSVKFSGQDDISVLNYIRKYHLQLPSPRNEPYNISLPVHNGGVTQYITNLFNNKTGGFFIECGANNGEYLSNTMLLERYYSWTGLLVEGDTDSLKMLRMKKRKSWIGDFCLSPVPYPVQLNLEKAAYLAMTHLDGYFFKDPGKVHARGKFTVQCFPLYSVLRALNVKTVDFFSLDVEGAELPILKTFPFDDSVIIKVISLEYRGNKLEDFDSFLGSKGYRRLALISEGGHTLDAIYAHESFQ